MKEENNKETYEQKMSCENCGHNFIEDFPVSTSCAGYNYCPNCKCLRAKALGKPKRYDEITMKTL